MATKKEDVIKVRVLMALQLDSAVYSANTALQLDRKVADSLIKSGFVDSDPAAVEYALTQGELQVHTAQGQANSPEPVSDENRDQQIIE